MFGDALGEFAVAEGEAIAFALSNLERSRIDKYLFTHELETVDENGDSLTVYFATKSFVTGDTDSPPSQAFRELIIDPGTVRRQVFGSGRDAGFVAPTWGGIEYINTSGSFDDWVDYTTDGGKLICRYGRLGDAFPGQFQTVYIAYVDGPPSMDHYVMRLSLRGRERLFDAKIVTEGFAPPVPLFFNGVDVGGTGVAAGRLRFLVFGTPGFIEPILLDEIENIWFLGENPSLIEYYEPKFYDGGVELPLQAAIGAVVLPGRFTYWPYGPRYAQLGSTVRFESRIYTDGGYASPDMFVIPQTERRWNIVDLAQRAGITDANALNMPANSVVFDAGNRVVETQTYKDVFNDIARFEVASIGFNRLDQFYARRIEPVTGAFGLPTSPARYLFIDGNGGNTTGLSIAPLPGMEKRVWQVRVNSGETHKSSLAGDPAGEVRDAMSLDNWMVRFTATAQSVRDASPGAEIVELDIIGNEFEYRSTGLDSLGNIVTLPSGTSTSPAGTKVEDWALKYLQIFGAHQFGATLETPFNTAAMQLDLLDTVQLYSTRAAAWFRFARIWSIDMQLKRRVIRFGLWDERATDAPVAEDIVISNVDDLHGAGGNSNGTYAAGRKDAAPQEETFYVVASDEITALTTGAAKRTWICTYERGFYILDLVATLTTPQVAGATFTVDVNINGATILSTKLTVDNTEYTSGTAVVPFVITSRTLLFGDRVTVDVDAIGDGTAKGLSVSVIGYQT